MAKRNESVFGVLATLEKASNGHVPLLLGTIGVQKDHARHAHALAHDTHRFDVFAPLVRTELAKARVHHKADLERILLFLDRSDDARLASDGGRIRLRRARGYAPTSFTLLWVPVVHCLFLS